MANNIGYQFTFSQLPETVSCFARVTFSSGAPTLELGAGFTSVAKVSTGLYDFFLAEPYVALLSVSTKFITAAASFPAAGLDQVALDSVSASTPKVRIQFNDADTPAATDPADGDTLILRVDLQNVAS